MNRAILWLVMCLVFPVAVNAQELSAEDEEIYRRSARRQMIEADIAATEDRKTTGWIYMGVGLGIELVSIVAFMPQTTIVSDTSSPAGFKTKETGNPPLFYGGLVVGSVVSLVGLWKWTDAYTEGYMLKMKKYELGIIQKGGNKYVAFQHTF